MRAAIAGAGLTIFTFCAAFGQTAEEPTTFEVASVKPAEPSPMGMISVQMRGGPGTADPGQLTYTNVSMKNILTNAYGVKGYQINGPKWLDTSERFDITAKIPMGATREQFKLMFQNLLAERFKLVLHHETKDLPMYALVVGKGGPKMKEPVEGAATAPPPPSPPLGSDGAGPVRLKMGADGMPQLPPGVGKNGIVMMMVNGNGGMRMRMVANGQPVSALIDTLADQLGRPVVDATGLKAKYDITLDFAPDGLNGPMGGMSPPPPPDGGGAVPMASASDGAGGPTIFAALQEQLGLKLEQRKGPVDLLVIDRLEKVPTEN